MGPVGYRETSVRNYHYCLRDNQKSAVLTDYRIFQPLKQKLWDEPNKLWEFVEYIVGLAKLF